MSKRLIIFLVFLISIFFISSVTAAGQIIINEIMYDLPGADGIDAQHTHSHEWIEIKNISGSEINLSGWKFNDGSNHNLIAPPDKGGQGSLVIPAGGFAILADDAITFLSDHPGFSGTVIDTVMSLNNTADILKILNADGQVIDEISYTKEIGAAGDGYALERVNDYSTQFCVSQYLGGSAGLANVPNCFVATPTPNPTPTPTPIPTINPTPTLPPTGGPTPTSSPIQSLAASLMPSPASTSVSETTTISLNINEFIPNPDGSDEENEWIEIYNAGETEVSLSGWKLTDASDKKYNFTNEKINSKEYLVLTRPQTKITINNDAETLSLISPKGEVISQIQYSGGSQEGYSFARYAKNDWRWTNLLTPGEVNEFSKEQNKNNSTVENKADISLSPFPSVIPLSAEEASSLHKIIFIALGVGFVFSIAVLIFMKKFIP